MVPTDTHRSSITALIPAGNEQANIEACIASVAWADEVFVVDSYSTDGTAELARAAGARVVQHEYANSATQKNWAIPQAAHGWVLVVDSDERVTPELRDEILAILERDARDPGSVRDGYRVRRLNHFLGHEVRYCGWQNDMVLRLFRRDASRYQDREVHADVIVESGRIGELNARMLHYTYRDFAHYMKKFDQYTSWAAGDRDRVTGRVGYAQLFFRPVGRFFKQFILKRGFLDGHVGLIICTLAAFSVFLKYAKLYERRNIDPADEREMRAAQSAARPAAEPRP